MPNQGGAFVPTDDYTVSGDWIFEGTVTANGGLDPGTSFVDATLTGTTTIGAGATISAPTLITPALGAATATSVAATGAVTSSGGEIGYVAGNGGTQTQITSKATTVILNERCGAITMHNAELVADAIVSFTLTNSTISITDVLILNHISGGTVGAYTLNAQAGAGSAVINVANRSAGNLSDAIVIQFAVFGAVNT